MFGPARWSSLRQLPNPQRPDWTGAIASLITGPDASAILWEGKDFGGKRVRLEPDRLVPGPEELPLPSVGSLAIECVEE